MLTIPFSPSRMGSTSILRKYFKNELKKGDKILDVGCGRYYLVEMLKEWLNKISYTGIDKKIVFRKKKSNLDLNIIESDLFNFNSQDSFDHIFCLWVLEHIRDDHKALLKIAGLANDKTRIILAVPTIWTWPFEFGRHGFHYYGKEEFTKIIEESGLKILKNYEIGGFFGWLFMLWYNWPRFLILPFLLTVYKLLKTFGLIKSQSWSTFSSKFVYNTFYFYHRFQCGVALHNYFVSFILKSDEIFKFFPSSYLYVLKREGYTRPRLNF